MKHDKGMPADIIGRARAFAVNAHTRIGHLRKYHKLPYATHLHNVAALVASVTDDPETLAAAWLHDVVEDTPATLEDVEKALGGFTSKNAAVEAIKQVESLRNNLVHTQDIVTHDWAAIARIASRLEEAVLLRRSHPGRHDSGYSSAR